MPYTEPETAVPAETPPLEACPVCRSTHIQWLATLGHRRYWRCRGCEAAFLAPRSYLPREAEHAHYRTHENHPQDPNYRRFLSRLAAPLLERLPARSEGLDYGCGPGPALAAMLHEAGHRVMLYDPLFFPDTAPLQHQYDFVTCSEVAEHFHDPAAEFDRLMGLVRPGGWLAVMTSFCPNDAAFSGWYYLRDPTHVVFYRQSTLRHVATAGGWSCACPADNVVLMQKPAGRSA